MTQNLLYIKYRGVNSCEFLQGGLFSFQRGLSNPWKPLILATFLEMLLDFEEKK